VGGGPRVGLLRHGQRGVPPHQGQVGALPPDSRCGFRPREEALLDFRARVGEGVWPHGRRRVLAGRSRLCWQQAHPDERAVERRRSGQRGLRLAVLC